MDTLKQFFFVTLLLYLNIILLKIFSLKTNAENTK